MPSDFRAVEIVYGMLLAERQNALRDNVARHAGLVGVGCRCPQRGALTDRRDHGPLSGDLA